MCPGSCRAESRRLLANGEVVASWLFGLLDIALGYVIAGFVGACILIAIARAFSGGLQQGT